MHDTHKLMGPFRGFAALAIIPLLVSCGGGGDGTPNSPPMFSMSSQHTLLEGTSGLTLMATDANGDNINFSVVAGVDKAMFLVANSNVLTFATESDFENPADADKNNEYLVTVRAADMSSYRNKDLVIKVVDAFEGRVVDGPISGASIFVDLNGDRAQNSNESSGSTSETGYFKIPQSTPVEGVTPKIISYGGTDSKTGNSLTQFSLISNIPSPITCLSLSCVKPDSAFVTPLITVLSETASSVDREKILTAFGISDTAENLLMTDIWKSAEEGNETSKNIQRVNQKIALLFQTANTLSGVDGLPKSLLVAKSVSSEVLSLITSQNGIDLTAREIVTLLLKNILEITLPDSTISESSISAVAIPVSNINVVFSDSEVDPVGNTSLGVVSASQARLQASIASFILGDLSASEFTEKSTANALFVDVEVPVGVSNYDADTVPDIIDFDDDNDGVDDKKDVFPLDASESLDSDKDGIGDNADTDDDNDGVADTSDAFPFDATEAYDTDSDGVGNNADPDDDNDGVADGSDDYPLNGNVHTAPVATPATHHLRLQPVPQTSGIVTLTGTAQENRALSYVLVSDGSHGAASINSTTGKLTYVPATSTTDSVTDAITFKVSDGYVYSSVSTVTLELRTDPLYKYQWHLDNTKQTNFSAAGGLLGEDLNIDSVISGGTTGNTVTVAVIDTGLEIAHEDLAANIVSGKSWDYSDSDTDPTSHHNDGDHGTSVAGIIASVGWNKIGGRGVAPDASLVGYNFLHLQSISNEIHAMGLDNELAAGVDIFNMSYGRNSLQVFQLGGVNTLREAAFVNGVTTMRNQKGALYVKSAGNSWSSSGYCGPNSAWLDHLACTDSVLDPVFALPYVIGVGALNAKGLRSSYSTPGATIWVSGFGGEFGIDNPAIMSVDQSSCSSGYVKNGTTGWNAFDNQGYHSENSSCNYMSTMNGTSSAAPTVTGVIALMLEENPNLTWRDVKKILASTARQVDATRTVSVNGIEQYSWITNAAGYKFHNWYGFGAVDAAAAVSSAKAYENNSLGAFVETGWNSSATVTATMVDSTTHYIDVPITYPPGSSGVIEFVRLKISLRHSKPNSLGIRLQAPSGTVSTLLQPYTRLSSDPNADCSAESTCTYFELASNAFYGEYITGTWRLLVTDHISDGTQGIFEKYQINIYGH